MTRAVGTKAGEFAKPMAAFERISCAGEWPAVVVAIPVAEAIANTLAACLRLCTDDTKVIAIGVNAIANGAAAIMDRPDTIAAGDI